MKHIKLPRINCVTVCREIGDFIIIGDHMGVIEHIGIKTTRIRSLGGEQLVVSNTESKPMIWPAYSSGKDGALKPWLKLACAVNSGVTSQRRASLGLKLPPKSS